MESEQANIYTNNWKVDREKICVLPADVDFDADEPCGADYAKSLAAKDECHSFIDNAALLRCADEVDRKFYYHSCLFDFCFMTLLREDSDPFALPQPSITPACTTARAYAAHCELRGISMRGWDVYMSCPVEEAQDAIISISCLAETVPFTRL